MPDPIQGVNAPQPIDVTSTGQATPASTNAGAAPPPPTASTLDSADVARAEALLAAIAASSRGVPNVDQAQVAELRRAIQSGTYQISPQQIAQKIMEIEQLLAGKVP
jgi:negative regulator of flagellin synthesis FlgM